MSPSKVHRLERELEWQRRAEDLDTRSKWSWLGSCGCSSCQHMLYVYKWYVYIYTYSSHVAYIICIEHYETMCLTIYRTNHSKSANTYCQKGMVQTDSWHHVVEPDGLDHLSKDFLHTFLLSSGPQIGWVFCGQTRAKGKFNTTKEHRNRNIQKYVKYVDFKMSKCEIIGMELWIGAEDYWRLRSHRNSTSVRSSKSW